MTYFYKFRKNINTQAVITTDKILSVFTSVHGCSQVFMVFTVFMLQKNEHLFYHNTTGVIQLKRPFALQRAFLIFN